MQAKNETNEYTIHLPKKKNEKIKIAHIIMLKNVRALVENNVAILYIFV